MPLITLTSDIGSQDYLAGAIKGQLLQLCNNCNIIDITHQILPFNVSQAAYLCRSAIPHFPEGTFHFILVNVFPEKNVQWLMVKHQGHYFLCADNGLLTMILGSTPEQLISLPYDSGEDWNIIKVVNLFAEAVNLVADGEALESIGNKPEKIIERNNLQPLYGDNWMEAQIIYIDNFENVIVNVTREQFEQHRRGRSFRIFFMRDEYISAISRSYADVPEGKALALFNTAGYLEIAINKGNAAGLFGLHSVGASAQQSSYHQSRLSYQTIRIIFE